MNQFNALHVDETTDPPTEWNRQPPVAHFKPIISPPKISPVVSAIMGRLNNCSIDNGDAEIHNSEIQLESNYESVPDTYTTAIKSNDNDEMYHLL